jgi:uncharacterized protein (TIGR02453 family)
VAPNLRPPQGLGKVQISLTADLFMAKQAGPYFGPGLFKFLRDLARHNERDWFLANKPRYEAEVRAPLQRFIADLAAPLREISPHFIADPRTVGGSMFRIQRDTRFAREKTPYKTWAAARFAHARHREVGGDAPVFYLHLKPGECFLGAGLWHAQPPALRRVRDYMLGNPASWKAATRSAAFRRRFAMEGEALTRPPRGYDPEHELIDDIKRKDFVAGAAIADEIVLSPQLMKTVLAQYRQLAPMVDWLCGALELEF